MKNLVLTGLSGSGKTTLGKKIAARLGLPFVDLDHEVERLAGLSISKLFAGYGEPFFREMETLAVKRASERGGQVIATGGGVVLKAANMTLLAENGFIVYVDRPVERIQADIRTDARPLLKNNAAKLREMDELRRPLYRKYANYVLKNTGGRQAALEQLTEAYKTQAAPDYAVIGSPIGHSLSPPIHEAMFRAQGKGLTYDIIRVEPEGLEAFVKGAGALGLKGFNVTIPHKQAIIPLLNEVWPEALACGAVNTVAFKDGKLCGTNTDMEGLSLALTNAGHGFAGRRVLLLGTGGAASAVAHKAVLCGAATLCVLGRSKDKREGLAAKAGKNGSTMVSHSPLDGEAMAEKAAHCDLLINATPMGMRGAGSVFESLDFLNCLPKEAMVYDLVYNPAQTPLVERARQLGLDAENGLGMLIYQAILAQEFYFGKQLDHETLYRAATNELKQNNKEMFI